MANLSNRIAVRKPEGVWRRIRYRRLTVGRWPRQRKIIVVTIRAAYLARGGR